MRNPYGVVKEFEAALSEYTGAPYVVTTTSCTTALLLACRYWRGRVFRPLFVRIPSRTYVGVPMSILHAGLGLLFSNSEWRGEYQLEGLSVWDSARRFTSDMYVPGRMQCVSFHWSKILAIGQGGAILHDNEEADAWLRRARFDGRTEGVPASEDEPAHLGYHAYMSPRDAAEGLSRLAVLPKHNEDLPNDDYPDLSKMAIFR